MKKLIDLIAKNHPELAAYYELSNADNSLDVEGLVRAYGIDERYHTTFRVAVYAAYLSIKRLAKKEGTKERLEREFAEKISKI